MRTLIFLLILGSSFVHAQYNEAELKLINTSIAQLEKHVFNLNREFVSLNNSVLSNTQLNNQLELMRVKMDFIKERVFELDKLTSPLKTISLDVGHLKLAVNAIDVTKLEAKINEKYELVKVQSEGEHKVLSSETLRLAAVNSSQQLRDMTFIAIGVLGFFGFLLNLYFRMVSNEQVRLATEKYTTVTDEKLQALSEKHNTILQETTDKKLLVLSKQYDTVLKETEEEFKRIIQEIKNVHAIDMEESTKNIEEVREEAEESVFISRAFASLSDQSTETDRFKAVERLKQDLLSEPKHRLYAILAGRLLRKDKKFQDAIEVLTRYINSKAADGEFDEDYADVLYNRACYSVLIAHEEQATDTEKLVNKAITDLRKSIDLKPINAKDADEDPDFKKIKLHPEFLKLLGK
jgi:tetratricopeptide (TPR) repeat protein